MIKNSHVKKQPGQVLVSVLIFMSFGLVIITMSAALTVINMQNTMKYAESARALNYAEAGAEEGIMRLIRDPSYSGGTLPLDSAVITLTVLTNGTNKTLTSTAVYNGFTKKVLVQLSLAGGIVSVTTWNEIN